MANDSKPAYDPAFIKLVQAALAKKRTGKKLKRDELRAIARYEQDEDERASRRHYAAVPKKLWCEWSGRHRSQLLDQAATYGLPVSGETIDLAAFVKWLHDFLADNAYALRDVDEDDGSEAGERLKNLRIKNELLEIELAAAKRDSVPREAVRAGLGCISTRLRAASELLLRRFGSDAHDVYNEALDDAERHIEAMFTERPAAS